jgi:dUTP pyrophosphatase
VRLNVARVDPSLPLPGYATDGSAAFDLYSRQDVVIAPGSFARLPTNVIVSVPDGYTLVVSLRSSTPGRKGLISPHGIGVIDSDYSGAEDEVHVLVYNIGSEAVRVERGERIAQALVLSVSRVEWNETPPAGPSRGGFGSTG